MLTICYVPMYNTLLFIEIDSENVQPMLQIAPGICVPNDIAGTSNQGMEICTDTDNQGKMLI